MTDTILQILHDYESRTRIESGRTPLSAWRLSSSQNSGRQRYYIGTRLDQKRAIETASYLLTVYVDQAPPSADPDAAQNARARGEATRSIHPGSTPEEIRAVLHEALHAASCTRAPWFDLPGSSPARTEIPASAFAPPQLESQMDALVSAILGAQAERATDADSPPAHINSLEIFLFHSRRRILNSRGCDVAFERWDGSGELIAQSAGATGPVELYTPFSFSEPDTSRLAALASTWLTLASDRARATPTPALTGIPVILRGENAEAVLAWFHDSARADLVYARASIFGIGSAIQGEAQAVEPIDTAAEAWIPGLPQSSPWDPEGRPLERAAVITAGKVVALHGPGRYAERLGAPVLGASELFSCSPGRLSLAQLRAQPHLEIFLFSDFSLDQASGAFGAEIRLARWFDGSRSIPVTGGSMTGSIMENRQAMLRSSERDLATRSLCPIAVLVPDVSITAAEKA